MVTFWVSRSYGQGGVQMLVQILSASTCLTLFEVRRLLIAHSLVAVHGLAGGPLTTWNHENGNCWIVDFLPKSLKNVRILSFGYPAKEPYLQTEEPTSRRTGRTFTFAEALCNDLVDLRAGKVLPSSLENTCSSPSKSCSQNLQSLSSDMGLVVSSLKAYVDLEYFTLHYIV